MDFRQGQVQSGGDDSEFQRAMPEPRLTKKGIMESREISRQKQIQYLEERDVRTLREYVNSLIRFYQDIHVYIENLKKAGKDYSKLDSLRTPENLDSPEQVTDEKVEEYIDTWYELNQAVNDLGITDIGIQGSSHQFGQALVNQFGVDVPYKRSDFDLEVEDADLGWIRLLLEFQNVRTALRQDKDVVGGVFAKGEGSGNRLGKTTLALHLAEVVENGVNKGGLPKRAICLTDDDFWTAQEKRPKYSAIVLDELSGVFYSPDAMKEDQRRRKKRMKTGAKKNQFQIGTDTNFYKVDKEFVSDKFDFVILIPERGKFELYGPNQIAEFEKDPDTGQIATDKLPDPLFKGKFPKIPEDSELWETYQEKEDEKIVQAEKESEEEINIPQYVKMVKDRKDYFKKEVNGKVIIDRNLIQAEFQEVGRERGKQIKAKVEADLGLNGS